MDQKRFIFVCVFLLQVSSPLVLAQSAEELSDVKPGCESLANVAGKVKKSACCDTDKINDPKIKGSVFYASLTTETEMEVLSKDDVCTKNNTAVIQYFCEGLARSKEKISPCPHACFDGRCVEPVCEDPDADVNPKDAVSSDLLVGSKVQVKLEGQFSDSQKDACVEDQAGKLIYEKFCSADKTKIKTALVPCPSGHACKYDEEGEAYCKSKTPTPSCTDLNKTPVNVFSEQGLLFSMGGSEPINKNNLCLSDPSAKEILAKYFPDYAGKADKTILDLTCLDLNKDGKDDIPGKPLATECPVDHECQSGQCIPVEIKQTCADTEALAFAQGEAGSVTDKHYAGEITLIMEGIALPVQKDYCDPQDDWMLVELQCSAKGTEIAVPIKQACASDEICEAGKCVPLFVCGDEVPGPYGISSEACPIGHMLRADEMTTDDADGNDVYDSCEYPKLVSRASGGENGNGHSHDPGLSADGGKLIYSSSSSNLVDDDTNGKIDIFLFDRKTYETTRVNTKADGTEANGWSDPTTQSIDACGGYAAFSSNADNLGETKAEWKNEKSFIKDLKEGTLSEIKLPADPKSNYQWGIKVMEPRISADGNWVAVFHQPYLEKGIWRVNRTTLEAEHITNVSNLEFSLSRHGEGLALEVPASFSPLPADQNQEIDAYLYDIQSDQFTPLNMTPAGSIGKYQSYGPALSWNKRWAVFVADTPDLVEGSELPAWEAERQLYLRDVTLGKTTHIKVPEADDGDYWTSVLLRPVLSANGRWVVWLAGGEGGGLVVYDRVTKESKVVSGWGQSGKLSFEQPAISADGRWIAFGSAVVIDTGGLFKNIFVTYNPLWKAE